MSAFEIRSLTKRYGDVYALRGINLAVEQGEVFGFLGPNGAGKSTTIDILLDFVRPTSGEVSVLGHDPTQEPRQVRERIGVLPQASGYYDRLTAQDHVALAIESKRTDDDPAALLDRVGIADAADKPVGEFSTGMRQRLGLAIALVGEPALLVLDEPLSGLDPSGARLLRRVVRAERKRGAAVFLSSHIMDQVATLCDRIGILHDGDLVAVDTIGGLREQFDVHEPVVLIAGDVPPDVAIDDTDGVTDVEQSKGTVRIACRNAPVAGHVVARLDDAGGLLRDIRTEGASLESLFVAATNREVPA